MKTKFFAVLAGMSLITAGCMSTVSGTKAPGVPFAKDSVPGRYQRSLDQVYQAAIQVVQNNGVLVTEYIPHDNTNAMRSLYGKVNERNVWVRVEAVDPQTTQVDVEARSKWGGSDLDLAHLLEKEVALQLSR